MWHHVILVQFMVSCDLWQTYDWKTTVKMFKTLQVFQLQVMFVKICGQSPEPAVIPKIQYYVDIDNEELQSPTQDLGKEKQGPPTMTICWQHWNVSFQKESKILVYLTVPLRSSDHPMLHITGGNHWLRWSVWGIWCYIAIYEHAVPEFLP